MELGKNQFLFTDISVEGIRYYKKIAIGDYFLYLGNECNLISSFSHDCEIHFLGYVTDALCGTRSEKEIVESIIPNVSCDESSLTSLTEMLGGRWVCFCRIKDVMYVWNDACSLKQVFYDTALVNREMCVASQARYIAFVANRSEDSSAKQFFEIAKKEPEFSFPLNATLYSSIKRLLPNHYLSSRCSTSMRMRNTPPFGRLPYTQESVERISVWLENNTTSAAINRQLVVTITGGLDSRMALATCANIKNSIRAITIRYLDMPEHHHDLVISSEYCKLASVKHDIITCSSLNEDFVFKYRQHSEHAHEYWIQMSQCLEENGLGDYLLVKGSCNEVFQNPVGVLHKKMVTPKILCKLFNIPITPFSLSTIEEWLLDAEGASSDIDLLSLFYWEHRMGSWFAECVNESDCVGDTFTPFNVRAILLSLSTVPLKARVAPKFKIYRDILEYMENSATSIPINPGRYSTLFSKLKLFVKYRAPFIYNLYIRMFMK